MNALVPVVMFGWLAAVPIIFSMLPPRRAVIVGFLFAFLFLPMATYQYPGMPPYNKMNATCLGVLIGALIFDASRFTKFRFKWIDVTLLFCFLPIGSYLSNSQGWGLLASSLLVLNWFVPYFIGRLYFDDLESINELALYIFKGGLVYVPLCLIEIRLSPQLHNWVYGFHAHSFAETVRYGGFRPTVFMQTGLMVGMWMAMTTLVAFWLWYTSAVREYLSIKMGWWVLVLLGTTILCKSSGAIVLMAGGMAILVATDLTRSSIPLSVLTAISPVYLTLRCFGLWSGTDLVDLTIYITGSPERAESILVRLTQENLAMAEVRVKPWLGWAHVENGNDQLWLIYLHSFGLFTTIALLAFFLLPAYLALRYWSIRELVSSRMASAFVLAMISVLSMIDNLSNAMFIPIFVIGIGSISGLFAKPPPRTRPMAMSTDHYENPRYTPKLEHQA